MAGLTELTAILRELSPTVREGRFVYVLRPADSYDSMDSFEWEALEIEAHAVIKEGDDAALVVEEASAQDYDVDYDGVFAWITLEVFSSLHAVGLTAAVSTALAEAGISCNVIAGLKHDHLLVPIDRVDDALEVLEGLAQ